MTATRQPLVDGGCAIRKGAVIVFPDRHREHVRLDLVGRLDVDCDLPHRAAMLSE